MSSKQNSENSIDINEPLSTCLDKFTGGTGNVEDRKRLLFEQFELLAKKMIFGGFFKVREDYAIFIDTVEFYFHDERNDGEVSIKDEIVYHRNGRFVFRNEKNETMSAELPYFPKMTLHAHWSGIDITFENPDEQYRASALIRRYVVFDIKRKKYIKLDTTNKQDKQDKWFVGRMVFQDKPYIDKRSTYIQYFLNGFSAEADKSTVFWKDIDIKGEPKLKEKDHARQHADANNWAFSGEGTEDYIKEYIASNKI